MSFPCHFAVSLQLYQKDQLKIIALPHFFIHFFSIRVRITLVEHFSLFIEKDYLIMLLVWRQVMQNACSHRRQQGALPWNVSLFQALGQWGKTRKQHAREKQVGQESFLSLYFSCLHFLNSADPTISEPGTGYDTLCVCI